MVSNASLWPCLHSLHYISWTFPCTLCRLSGIVILLLASICFIFNIRFLFAKQCTNSLVISLFLSSLLVISISVPGVLIQLFTCHRHCLNIYCRIEGFSSYLAGCVCMLVFMALSIHRYLSLCAYKYPITYGISTAISWLISLIFTFPLIFGYLNAYQPEGLGFHCSVNWQDSSNISRLYILLSFILLYFIPLAILIYVNIRAHLIVRHVYSREHLNSLFTLYSNERLSIKMRRHTDLEKNSLHQYCLRQATARRRFRTDYRFLRAIIFLVGSYLIAWTPYAVVAILQLLNTEFIFKNASLITISAFIAKTSVIVTPFFYLSIMNYKLFKKTLFK